MSLLDKILKNSTLKHTSLLSESEVFNEKDVFTTPVPAINIALSGSITGGLTPGLLQIAGESKHFKSAFALLIAGSFMKANPEGVIIFYDSEFGTPESYFDSFNINKDRVVHSPITNVEEFKHDIMSQLDGISRGEKVCIIVDSIGNLASLKEVEDTLAGKNTADMTRAKALKSLGRMITPHLTLKNIPMIAVNHIYKELGMFPKNIVSGGTGLYLSSDNIWIIGRQQDKDTEGLNGYHFIINIEKSRHVKEKSKIPITVSFEGGINKFSGLFEMAKEAGLIREAKKGWYTIDNEKNFRRDAVNISAFWDPILKSQVFCDYIELKYKISNVQMIQEQVVNE